MTVKRIVDLHVKLEKRKRRWNIEGSMAANAESTTKSRIRLTSYHLLTFLAVKDRGPYYRM